MDPAKINFLSTCEANLNSLETRLCVYDEVVRAGLGEG